MTTFQNQLQNYLQGNAKDCPHPIRAVDENDFCHDCGTQLKLKCFDVSADLQAQVTAQAAEIAKYREALKMFLENFETCSTCESEETEDACHDCGGTGRQIVSRGMLYTDIYEAAREALK